MDHRAGSIEVICGSMFCGKTDELIRRLRRATIAKQKVQVFKPSIDNRFEEQRVASHAGSTFDAIAIAYSKEILPQFADDTTVVVSRDRCKCGRTHMRILNPQREGETLWVAGVPFNKVNVEQGVFYRDNMDYLTGEYEAFLQGSNDKSILKVRMEYTDPKFPRDMIENNFIKTFYKNSPGMHQAHVDGSFNIIFEFIEQEGLEFYHSNDRPKRLIDCR